MENPPDLRRPRAGGIGGIEPVNIKADVGGTATHDSACLGNDPLDAEGEEFLYVNNPDAGVDGKFLVFHIVNRPPNADLDRSLRVKQAFLDGAPERRSMGKFVATEIAVVCVGMGIKMYHAHRPGLRDGPKDRQADQVVAAGRQGHRASRMQLGIKTLDAGETVYQVDGVDGRVAVVADSTQLIRRDAADMMDAPHEA